MQAEAGSTLFARIFIDAPVTLAAWAYYILAFVVAFAPFYLAACLCPCRKLAFQYLNHLYCRGFFAQLRLLAPRQHWQIDPRLDTSRGAVVLCNHLSYLDPLLLMAAMRRSATVVKARFFHLPIFGWVLKSAGYLPSSTEGGFAALMLKQMEGLKSYLAEGGNLFIFPEGTRSRNGAPLPLQHGSLKLARLSKAPLLVFRISNTNILFPPGRFLFNASRANSIRVDFVAAIQPQDAIYQGPLGELEAHLRSLLADTPQENQHHSPPPKHLHPIHKAPQATP